MSQLLSYQAYSDIIRKETITEDHLTVYNHYVKDSPYKYVEDFKQDIINKIVPATMIPKKTWEIYDLDTKKVIGHTYFILNLIVGIKIHSGVVGENYEAKWLNSPFYNTKHSISVNEPWEERYTISPSAEVKWDRDGNVVQRNIFCQGYSKLPADIKKDLTDYPHRDIILTYSRKTSGIRIIVSKCGRINPIYTTIGIII